MNRSHKYLIFVLSLLMVVILFTPSFAGSDKIQKEKEKVVVDSSDMESVLRGALSSLDESLEGFANMIDRTFVLYIPDEKGFIGIDSWKDYSDDNKKKELFKIAEINKRLKVLYKSKIYNMIFLYVGKNVRFEYLYQVVHSIEEYLNKNNLLKDEKNQLPTYVFFFKPN